ncbi:MAG: TetR/AcrR family transcriptional regulator [Acidimicrobiales bacterium]
MDAAIEVLTERGVLAGLNLREVADIVGVTPANIYHLFGSRQGLLRAALQRETDTLLSDLDEARTMSFVDRRLRMFDVIGAHPKLALTALLAVDGDPDYQPLPYLDATRIEYAIQREAGEIPIGMDVEALHLMSLIVSIGTAVYGESAARQFGVDTEELSRRVRKIFEEALRSLFEA